MGLERVEGEVDVEFLAGGVGSGLDDGSEAWGVVAEGGGESEEEGEGVLLLVLDDDGGRGQCRESEFVEGDGVFRLFVVVGGDGAVLDVDDPVAPVAVFFVDAAGQRRGGSEDGAVVDGEVVPVGVAGEDHADVVLVDEGKELLAVLVGGVDEGFLGGFELGVVVDDHEGERGVAAGVEVLGDPVELRLLDAAAPVEGGKGDAGAFGLGEVVGVEHLEVVGAVVEGVVVGAEVMGPEDFAVFAGFAVAVMVAGAQEGGDVEVLEEVIKLWVFVAVLVVVELAVDEVAADDDEVGVLEVDFLDSLKEGAVVEAAVDALGEASGVADVDVGDVDEGEIIFEFGDDVDGTGLGDGLGGSVVDEGDGEVVEFDGDGAWDGDVIDGGGVVLDVEGEGVGDWFVGGCDRDLGVGVVEIGEVEGEGEGVAGGDEDGV